MFLYYFYLKFILIIFVNFVKWICVVCLYIKNVDYWFIYKLNNFICGGWVSMIDRKFEVRNFIILLIKLMFEEFVWYKVYGSFN